MSFLCGEGLIVMFEKEEEQRDFLSFLCGEGLVVMFEKEEEERDLLSEGTCCNF